MIHPKKSLGQNFIIDQNINKKIVKQTKINNENIVEIGPGFGSLTDHILTKNPKSLTLIEKDTQLFNFLIDKYKNEKKIKIFNFDAINFNFSKFRNAIIISNLPYNVSTKIIMNLIFSKNIKSLIFMIQKELAVKFDYNKSKLNKYNFITKICSDYKILFEVSNNVFFPKPKVKSNVVEFKLKNIQIDKNNLLNFVNKIFSNKRKSLRSKIKNNFVNYKNISDKRVEELKFEELLEIYKFF